MGTIAIKANAARANVAKKVNEGNVVALLIFIVDYYSYQTFNDCYYRRYSTDCKIIPKADSLVSLKTECFESNQ